MADPPLWGVQFCGVQLLKLKVFSLKLWGVQLWGAKRRPLTTTSSSETSLLCSSRLTLLPGDFASSLKPMLCSTPVLRSSRYSASSFLCASRVLTLLLCFSAPAMSQHPQPPRWRFPCSSSSCFPLFHLPKLTTVQGFRASDPPKLTTVQGFRTSDPPNLTRVQHFRASNPQHCEFKLHLCLNRPGYSVVGGVGTLGTLPRCCSILLLAENRKPTCVWNAWFSFLFFLATPPPPSPPPVRWPLNSPKLNFPKLNSPQESVKS